MTLRGMPQLYSGDEIGMQGGADPDNRHDFPGGFRGDAHSAFTQSGRTVQEKEVFAWTSGLLKLRAAHTALQTGIEQNLFADENAFAFVRSLDETGCAPSHTTDRLLIVVNNAAKSKVVELPVEETALVGCAEFQAVAPATGTAPVVSGGKLRIEEPAQSITVYDVH
jgi:glycosidase